MATVEPFASPVAGPLWKRLAADVRPPLYAMAGLAVLMSVAFPLWRVTASREDYVRHLSDDAFYYLSVAPNIAAGRGPTADGITRTTGWHPLYGFMLAGLCRLTNPSLDGLPKEAIALNAVLYLLSAYVLYLAGRRWWGKPAGVAAALLWLTCAHGVYMAAAGLETSTYVFCLALLLWRLADLVTRPRSGAGYLWSCTVIGICAALAVLSRTDSVFLMPIVALIVLLAAGRTASSEPENQGASSPPTWFVRLSGLAIFGLLVIIAYASWIAYVWYYTHEINQGSAAIKMEWRKFLMRDKPFWAVVGITLAAWGEFLGFTFLKVSSLKWVLTGIPLLWQAARTRAQRGLFHLLWLAPVVLGLAYSLLLDWIRAWYCIPMLMTLTLLSGGAAAALLRVPRGAGPADAGLRDAQRRQNLLHGLQRLARNTLGLTAWLVVLECGISFTVQVYAQFKDDEKQIALRLADWLDKNAEPHARVGCWHSGFIGYYTPHIDVINLDGLNNNDILTIIRGDRLLNPYWDKIGLTVLLPPKNVAKDTGEVGEKMGQFKWEWGNKKLVPWEKAPGSRPPDNPLDIYEQAFRQRVYRVVEAAPSTSASSEQPNRS